MNVIEAEELSKSYSLREPTGRFGWLRAKRSIPAPSDVSFGVKRGEAVSILGPNGAGQCRGGAGSGQ